MTRAIRKFNRFELKYMFDLKIDPDEMNNLFDRPEGRQLRAEMMEKLAYTMMAYTNHGKAPEV